MIVVIGDEGGQTTYLEREAFDLKTQRWVSRFRRDYPGLDRNSMGAKGRGGREVTDQVLVFTIP
jgi:hypothetical protein